MAVKKTVEWEKRLLLKEKPSNILYDQIIEFLGE